jgi:hypothetical protein
VKKWEQQLFGGETDGSELYRKRIWRGCCEVVRKILDFLRKQWKVGD